MIVVQILLQVQLEMYWEQNREDAKLSQGVKVNQFEATTKWPLVFWEVILRPSFVTHKQMFSPL